MSNKFLLSFGVLISLVLSTSLLNAQSYLISQGGTITTCNGTLYDSGGSTGQYSNNEDYTITICSSTGGVITLFFSVFNLESATFDNLTIYDGPNTGSPVLVPSTGDQGLLNQTIVSSGSCLALVWHSDGSVGYAGFAAEISCMLPCQDFNAGIIASNPPFSIIDNYKFVSTCQENTVFFAANASFPNNNTEYFQSIQNCHWNWYISGASGGDYIEGMGLNQISYEFNDPGGYSVNLVVTDPMGCIYTLIDTLRVGVSLTPDFAGSISDQDIVCLGDVLSLSGVVNVDPWQFTIQELEFVEVCFEDIVGVDQEACFIHSAFAPGQFISAGSDVESICMNMEHSYMGDLDIWIECPNGNTVTLHNYPTCSSTYFGYPNHADDCNPGEGLNYCWTMSAPSAIADNCNGGNTLPAGDYLPYEDFESLVGCPLNGEWCIHFLDNLNLDDGTVFTVELHFADYLIPSGANSWQYTTTYDVSSGSTDIIWTGDGVQPNTGGDAIAYPITPGDQEFTFSATDNFGCTYDTIISVHVLDGNAPECLVYPNPDAGSSATVCGYTYTFSPIANPANDIVWEVILAPSGANIIWINQGTANAQIEVNTLGTYVFEITETNVGSGYTGTDQISLTFVPAPNVNLGADLELCNGNSASIYAGNGFIQYLWNGEPGPSHIEVSESGNYQVVVTDQNGCTASDEVIVTVYDPPSLQLGMTEESSSGASDGSAYAIATNGNPPYEYLWETGEIIDSITGLSSGIYCVRVADIHGCLDQDCITVLLDGEMSMPIAEFHAGLTSGCGTLSVSFTDLSLNNPTSWYWDFGDETYSNEEDPEHTYTTPGVYSVSLIVYNENGTSEENIKENYITIYPVPELALTSISQTNETPPDGSVEAIVENGTSPFEYLWSNGDTVSTLTGLESGTYCVTVSDINSCSAWDCAEVAPISSILPEVDFSANITEGCDILQVEFTNLSVNVPDTWYWNFGDGAISTEQSPVHTYTSPGVYSVSLFVANQNGEDYESKSGYIRVGGTPQLYFVTNSASSELSEDGAVTVYPTGGVYPYTYLWSNGFENNNIDGLYSAEYCVTVSDNVGCSAEDCIFLPFGDTGFEAGFLAYPTTGCAPMEVTFVDNSIGEVETRTWYTGDGYTYQGEQITHIYEYPGTYSVVLEITDSEGNIDQAIEPNFITVYELPQITLVSTELASGAQVADGGALISVTGGSFPYDILWSNGDTGYTLVDVLPGLYTVSVNDSNMCSDTSEIFIEWFVGSFIDGIGGIEVYPNPASKILYIVSEELEITNIEIVNVLGTKIIEVLERGNYYEVDVSFLNSGIYFVRISYGETEHIEKLIIK